MEYFEIIIKWDKIPKGYDFVAIDENGKMYAYRQKPEYYNNDWSEGDFTYICDVCPPTDFTKCLYERPQTETP
jgi:hypothetical protein